MKTGKSLILRGLIPFWYKTACLFTRPQKVMFLEIRYDAVTDNLALLQQAFLSDGKSSVTTYFLRTGEGSGFSYLRRCLTMARRLAGAKLVFVDESSDILAAIPLRKGSHVIQCWHACGAFKRFGHGLGALEREYYGPYAFVTVSAPAMVPHYMEAMHQPREKVLPLGVSRTDRFFDQDFLTKCRKQVRSFLGDKSEKKIILYAPTFRGNVADAKLPPLPDFGHLQETLGQQCILLYKGHPACKEGPDFSGALSDFCIDVSHRFSIEALMAAADYCITDYSSLVFEFALFDRPIFFYTPDKTAYGDERGFYYTVEELDAGPVCKDSASLARAILEELETGFEGISGAEKERLAAFRKRFMESCDGHATERILARARELFLSP